MHFRLAFRPRQLAASTRAILRVALLDLINRGTSKHGDGAHRVISPALRYLHNPLFDASFYRARYDLDLSDADLYLHYSHTGRFKSYDPNEYFSTSWYLERNKDVKILQIDPLDHYFERGANEGRDPGPAFSSWVYWLLNPDVKASGMNPLLHYMLHGRSEGRLAPTLQQLTNAEAAQGGISDPGEAGGGNHFPSPMKAEPVVETRDLAPQPKRGLTPRPRKTIKALREKSRGDDPSAARTIARYSPTRVLWFAKLFARDLASSFHGVRLLGTFPEPVDGPVVLLTNHPSWWDAELYHWLAVTGFAGRRGFAPMEANNLARYPSLTRLGAFPTWPNSGYKGAAAFLNTAEQLLQEPDAILFIAAEGRFRDQRERPVEVMPGVAHLARRVPTATFIPLAIDYVFWRDRRPNLLLHFGKPMSSAMLEGASTREIVSRFCVGLETAMSALAEAGMSRQPLRFTTLLEDRRSSRAVYSLWQGATSYANRASNLKGAFRRVSSSVMEGGRGAVE